MIHFNSIHLSSLKKKFFMTMAFVVGLSITAISQSPKKYLKNGFYEQAFVEAVFKQNKKVKLKKKYTEVIYPSYETIYSKHTADIISPDTDWGLSYSKLIRMLKFRAKVTHPGVMDKLKNMLYDQPILEHLASKFNDENLEDLKVAGNFESVQKYDKAFDLYQGMSIRHKQAEPITTLTDKLIIIDCEAKIKEMDQKIGDQYIEEAKEVLRGATKKEAVLAIDLINKARSHRPLDIEEEELKTLANLIIGESWITEAKKLLQTRTKKNARLAYELINRARSVRTLNAEEELLLEEAESLGMTRILLNVKGNKPHHNNQSLSGVLNRKKGSRWVTFLSEKDSEFIDFEMEVTENKPTVVLSDVRRQITQETKDVEYYEDVTDASGNTTKVKKTRKAVAMVARLSRTKTAKIDWSVSLRNPSSGEVIHSENRETKREILHEHASVESGDILALPDNVESDVELDSQPFPTDEEMLNQVKATYLSELIALVKIRKDHMLNINQIISE